MLIRVATFVLAATLAACGVREPKQSQNQNQNQGQSQSPSPKPSPSPTPTPSPIQNPSPSPTWTINKTSLSTLQIGSPLPQAIIHSPDLESQYTTSFYGDAQPLEGFTLSDPPAFVVVKGGPFADWGMENPGQKPPDTLRNRALSRARAGALSVEMIVITDPRPKTANGAFVSQDLAAFTRAYPDAPRKRLPALWEEPSCVAEQNGLWFFFDRCDIDAAKIIRIVIRNPSS